MNLFVGYGDEKGRRQVTCEGCGNKIFFEHAQHHSGSHFCYTCVSKGKHMSPGFGPMRFENKRGMKSRTEYDKY